MIPRPQHRDPAEYFEGGGRDFIYFVKDGKKLLIYAELCCEGLLGQSWRCVSLGDVAKHYEPPHQNEVVTPTIREEAFNKLLAYYAATGQKYQVDTFRM